MPQRAGRTPTIHPERPGDVAAIRTLTATAFRGVPHSSQTEAAIVDALRDAGALTLSLVARHESAIVGHVAFSPVVIEGQGDGWYGLGPVSVRPDMQRRGIGRALIEDGLGRLRRTGAQGCVVLGDPAYYARFGFESGGLSYGEVPPGYLQHLAFKDTVPAGEVRYHPGFEAT